MPCSVADGWMAGAVDAPTRAALAFNWPHASARASRRAYVLFLTYQTTRGGGGLPEVWQVHRGAWARVGAGAG